MAKSSMLIIATLWLVLVQPCPMTSQEAVPQGEALPDGEVGMQNSIVGTVTDPTGAAIPGATVSIRDTSTGVAKEASTDEMGNFRVAGLRPAEYRVTVSSAGFAPTEEVIHLMPGASNKVSFVLGGQVPQGEVTSQAALEVVQMTFRDEVEAQRWLNEQAKVGKRLLAVVPLEPQTSLFVLLATASHSADNHFVLRATGPLDAAHLKERIELHADRTFAGLHRIDRHSYLIFFSHGK